MLDGLSITNSRSDNPWALPFLASLWRGLALAFIKAARGAVAAGVAVQWVNDCQILPRGFRGAPLAALRLGAPRWPRFLTSVSQQQRVKVLLLCLVLPFGSHHQQQGPSWDAAWQAEHVFHCKGS